MKYFIIAGERSGDLHGSFLVEAVLNHQPDAQIVGYGGGMMEAAGMKLLSHYQEIAFMGFWEVAKNLWTISKKIRECEQALIAQRPDVLLLIDFPGFNLRMAKYASSQGLKVAYYISPKVWAWKEGRVNQIRKYVDRLYSILPFESSFFRKHNYEVEYVGNPVVEELDQYQFNDLPLTSKVGAKVAYLPGSRVQEVRSSVKMIIQCADLRPDLQFLVAGVENVPAELYHSLIGKENVQFFVGQTYEVLKAADVAIVTSGTATLEAALLNVPQVVCYKTSQLTYWIAKALVKIKYISLVNLIQDEPVLLERIQEDYTPEIILQDIDDLLTSENLRKEMLKEYQSLRETLGQQSASNNVAIRLKEWLTE